MNILITGAAGFVGKNLSAALHCLQNGTDRTRPGDRKSTRLNSSHKRTSISYAVFCLRSEERL